jgi:hypothetical protein
MLLAITDYRMKSLLNATLQDSGDPPISDIVSGGTTYKKYNSM